MKKVLSYIVLVTMIVCFTTCSSETETIEVQMERETEAFESLKSEIVSLNAEYASKVTSGTRLRPWLRWLVFGAADTAGAIFGGVSGACAASTLAWLVTKEEVHSTQPSVSSVPASAIKVNNLSNLTTGTIGYNHNSVISSVFKSDDNLYEKSVEEVYDVVLEELFLQTGICLDEDEKNDLVICVNRIIKCFDAKKDIDDFFNDLIVRTEDSNQKKILEICCEVIKGLQYVNDDDITYITNVRVAIVSSTVSPELKSMLDDAISVAYASAKLWNTDDMHLN